MRKRSLLGVFLLILLCGGAWMAYTQGPPAQPLTIDKLRDDLYVIIGDGGNVPVYLTDEGLIISDDKYERDNVEILAKIKTVSNLPVKYVLNTHSHGDHTGGNVKMFSTAEILSHRNARENMVTQKLPGAPRITFNDEASVTLGGKEVRAKYFGRGHTNGDAVIYYSAARVIHTGDLFLSAPNAAPFIDYSSGASALEWTGTIDRILQSDWSYDVVVPGHGPVVKKADLADFRDRLRKMRDRVGAMVQDGRSKDDIAKTLVSDFNWGPKGGGMLQLDSFIAEMKR